METKSFNTIVKLPILPNAYNHHNFRIFRIGKIKKLNLPSSYLSYLKYLGRLVSSGKNKVSPITSINKGFGKIGKVFRKKQFKQKFILPLITLSFLSCHNTDNRDTATLDNKEAFAYINPVVPTNPIYTALDLQLYYDAEDNIWQINNGEYHSNIDPDTEQCLSDEICIRVADNCDLYITSQKYIFHSATSISDDGYPITTQIINSRKSSTIIVSSSSPYACDNAISSSFEFNITAHNR